MRYAITCRFCEVSANATDLHSLGSQLNAHASICHYEPTVVISGERDAGDFAVEAVSKSTTINTNPRNGRPAFNAALFSLPSIGQIGNAPRRFFYGPGIYNFDMAVQKSVRFSESKSLEFRLEAFNVFNHAQFYGPAAVNGNISSTNFGQIVSAAAPRLMQLAAKFFF